MSAKDLIHVLERQLDIHEELLALAERKSAALVRDDANEVSAIVNKESKLIRIVDDLVKEQQEATNAFFRAKGFQPTRAITVTELARMVTEPTEKAELLNARDRLTAAIERLKLANEHNRQLILQSLSFINLSVDLIMGPSEDDAIYHRPSQPTISTGRPGMFDRKA